MYVFQFRESCLETSKDSTQLSLSSKFRNGPWAQTEDERHDSETGQKAGGHFLAISAGEGTSFGVFERSNGSLRIVLQSGVRELALVKTMRLVTVLPHSVVLINEGVFHSAMLEAMEASGICV